MHEPAGVVSERERHCPHCGGRLRIEKVANLPDLLVLLSLCRDAIDAGHADIASAVLSLVVEHQGSLGLRSRNLARRLIEQVREREQPPDAEAP
jgi:hypothetical protein